MSFGFPKGFDIENAPAATFPKAEFDGIVFPYTDVSVKGGIRHHVHEFPHSPGGEVEKMGRHPYQISFTAVMKTIPGSVLDREYPDLYPRGIRELREKFEQELTGKLIIPTVGKVQAVATSWTQHFDVKDPSGEMFALEFVEDQDAATTLLEKAINLGFSSVMFDKADTLTAAAAIADFKKQATVSVFQEISDAVTAVQGVFGQVDAYSRLVEGKIQAVVNLCSYADGQLEEMQNPQNHVVINALKDLWLASQQLAENVIESRQKLLTYTVPRLMTVGQVSTALYGTSEKSAEVLQLNAFQDAFAIPAGTQVRYLSAA